VKKTRRQRQQARPPSPGYSTDSNYGTADVSHKPFPRSQRRKQVTDSKLKKKGDNSNKEDNSATSDYISHPGLDGKSYYMI